MEISVGKLFGLKSIPDEIKVQVDDQESDYTPRADTDYVFDRELVSDFLAWLHFAGMGDGLYLTGDTGAGKTSFVLQMASRMNRPVQHVVGHARLELPSLVGQHVIKKGEMVFVHGPLAIAVKEGHWFLVDEFDLMDPGTVAGLNPVLDGSPLVIPENGGEVVKPHPKFRFIATANSNGNGDETGLYQGITRQNGALMDRFTMIRVEYPDRKVEEEIIMNAVPDMKSGIGKVVLKGMLDVAKEIRDLFRAGGASQMDVTFSTRTLVRWARFFTVVASRQDLDSPILYSLDRALAFRANETARTAIHEIVQRLVSKNTA